MLNRVGGSGGGRVGISDLAGAGGGRDADESGLEGGVGGKCVLEGPSFEESGLTNKAAAVAAFTMRVAHLLAPYLPW